MFSPGEVVKMDEELVKKVAGEPEDVEALRDDLTRRLSMLNMGLKETSRHVSRSVLCSYITSRQQRCRTDSSIAATRNAVRDGATHNKPHP